MTNTVQPIASDSIPPHAATNAAAAERGRWIRKAQFFHDSDIAYLRFLIPEGSRIIQLGCGIGHLLQALRPSFGVGVDINPGYISHARQAYPGMVFEEGDVEDEAFVETLARHGPFDFVLMADIVGLLRDCDQTLTLMRRLCGPKTRIIISYYNHVWEPVLELAEKLGLKMPQAKQSWLSTSDIEALLHMAGFEPVRREWRFLVPFRLLGIGTFINRYIATLPLIRRLCLRSYVVARPEAEPVPGEPRMTVLIPCRNEKGNIENAIRRLPPGVPNPEIIFVEGNSSDGTYEECLRVRDAYPEHDIKVLKQPGRGKGDAVRTGFAAATGDLLLILDADLTMPPEAISKFYKALVTGKGEFINGTRLVYPMDPNAMRHLNAIANRGFALIFSYLLNQRFTDTLCGTKALWRSDYLRIAAGRTYFGDFDPFGDFDLIFGAAKQNLKIVEIPIRYAAREYGETQISRFADGLMLARMVMFAWRKMKAL